MFATLFHVPELSLYTPEFILSLVVCGVAALICPDHRLATLAFLVQRLLLIVLLWPSITTPLASMSLITLVAVTLIYYITEWRPRRKETGQADKAGLFSVRLSFHMLAASLGILVTYGFAQTNHSNLLPPVAVLTVVWLFANGLLKILLAHSTTCILQSALLFSDSCRTVYAFKQPDPLIWGIWSVCDVLVVLAIAYFHLHNAHLAATKS